MPEGCNDIVHARSREAAASVERCAHLGVDGQAQHAVQEARDAAALALRRAPVPPAPKKTGSLENFRICSDSATSNNVQHAVSCGGMQHRIPRQCPMCFCTLTQVLALSKTQSAC